LGRAGAALINKGQIRVDQYGVFAVAGSSIDNQGTLEVSNNGILLFDANVNLANLGTVINNGGTFGLRQTLDNTAQTLNVDRPRGWLLRGGTIHGGTVQSSNAGTIWVPYLAAGTLDNVANLNATVEVSGTLNVTGTLGGNGTIAITNPEAIEAIGVVNIPTVP